MTSEDDVDTCLLSTTWMLISGMMYEAVVEYDLNRLISP